MQNNIIIDAKDCGIFCKVDFAKQQEVTCAFDF